MTTLKKTKTLVSQRGYKNQRSDLDKLPAGEFLLRALRKGSGPHYFTTITPNNLDSASGTSFYTKTQKEAVKRYIKGLKDEFKLVDGFNPEKYNGIDQGEEGACSFVGFLNLTIVSKKENLLIPTYDTRAKISKSWKGIWDSFGISTASDIGETLDKINSQGMFKTSINNHVRYLPIRSEGFNENKFNKDFWLDGPHLELILSKYGIDEKVYNAVPWCYQNAHLIEKLIDSGIPVEINALEHSRTCVGYNEHELLFADNWTKNYEQSSSNGTDDYFKGGFSRINKWAIYSWMRDIVYFVNPDTLIFGKDKKKTRKKLNTRRR